MFASVLDSFKNRWAWLAVNLVTAFIASRVIGVFEQSIAQLVALAALMPIVAGIGGNSGNQTITMIVRALALGQIQGSYWTKLLAKELGVALLNGVGLGHAPRRDRLRCCTGAWRSAAVMALAMTLNLMLAAAAGRGDPLAARALRPRSRRRLLGADHRVHRFRRLLHLPGTRYAFPSLSVENASTRRARACARSPPRRARPRRSPLRTPRARGRRRASSIAWKKRLKRSLSHCHHLVEAVGHATREIEAEHAADRLRARTRRRLASPRPRRPSVSARVVRFEPLVESRRSTSAQRREPRRDRDRIARQRSGLVHRAERRDLLHDRRACRRTRRPACRRRSPCRAS